MCDDPNGSRWSKSSKNIGKSMLQLSGWTEGSGLGKSQEGITSHIKTQRKDDVMGIGYAGGVQEAWSTQSVGFADVLSRIKEAVSGSKAEEVEEEVGSDSDGRSDKRGGNNHQAHTNNGDGRPVGGRHVGMYAKRHALKTELLRSKGGASSAEILGSASSSRKRKCDDNDSEAAELSSTLRSPLLQRTMQRVPKHELRRATEDSSDADTEEIVRITKPHPRPPKCTDTPFLATE